MCSAFITNIVRKLVHDHRIIKVSDIKMLVYKYYTTLFFNGVIKYMGGNNGYNYRAKYLDF